MNSLIKLYIQQFKTTLASTFQYRASLFIWMLGQILEPLVYLIVWSTVSNGSGGSVGTYSTSDFASYFIIFMVVNQITYTWIMYEFEWRIREGALSFALLKPVHPIHSDIADNISSKLITFPIILIIAVGLGIVFHAGIQPSLWMVLLLIPALVLGFFVRFFVEWTVAQAAFWTTRVSAVNEMYFFMLLFLSGQIAPISLLPNFVQIIAKILPFYWTLGFPVELILGRLTVVQTLIGLGAQAVWLVIGFILVRVVWRLGTKAYSAVGQ